MAKRDRPRGWMKKRTRMMPHEVPTTVELEMSGLTTLRPWTAPRTDCAGVRTPSERTMDTARTPIVLSRPRKTRLLSIRERTPRLPGRKFPV